MTPRALTACAAIAVCIAASAQETPKSATASACLAPATWYSLAGGKPRALAQAEILNDAVGREVVLLGESHNDFDHHQWQLQTLASVYLLRPRMVIGFEAFPRRVQPVLDQWVAGNLTQRQFLERVEWEKIWNVPAALYLPLFQFARLNRIPMAALNVDKKLTEEISKKGWDGVPAEQKEGVSRPAPATRAYEEYLFEVYKQHVHDKGSAAPNRSDAGFRRFGESQTTWDRAMAEALARHLKGERESRPLVVGIMGSGHVRNGYGVAHQLRDLGVTGIAALLPLEAETPCSDIKTALADAVFALPVAPREKPAPPRLGVQLEMRDKNVAIAAVTPSSLAEQSGIRAGDVVVSVAGAPVSSMASVTAAVREQPAGTWLPIQVRRGESTIDLVIKFPPKT